MGRIPFALFLLAVTSFNFPTTQKPTSHRACPRDTQPNVSTLDEQKMDADGEPLPGCAFARLGSSRWRHGSRIVRSALSLDGKRLATVSTSSVAVWDVASGKILFRFPTLTRKDRSQTFSYYSGHRILSFSPDGKKLGIAFDDTFTGVWDLENGGKFRRFTGEDVSNSFGLCRFTPDGKLFILLYEDCIRFWDPVTGKLHQQVRASFAVSDISADARMYAQIDHKRKFVFNVCDFQTGKLIRTFDVKAGEGELVFAPDCKTLVLVDELKKAIQIWDVRGNKKRCTFPLPRFAGVDGQDLFHEYCVCFSADSKMLMLSNSVGEIHRWDLATKKELPVLAIYPREIMEGKLRLAIGADGFVGLHDVPDGKILLAVAANGLIRRFDTTTNREFSDLGNYQGSPRATVSPNGRLAAVADNRGRLDLWELRPLKLRHTLRRDGPAIVSMAFAADGRTLAAGLESETVCFHDVASGRETRRISFKKGEQRNAEAVPFSTLLSSPDGRFLCVNSSGAELLMWDLANDRVRWRAKGEFAWDEGCAAFSPDGKTLAFAPKGPEVLLLDVLSGKRQRVIRLVVTSTEPLSQRVQSLAFAPDGRSLAVALGDGTIAILDPAAARTRRRLVIKSSLNGNLAFSPDGRTIAGGVMESVCLWDTNTGKMVSRIEGHSDRVNSVGFGPDGRTLLSCGDDLQVYLWSLKVKTRSRAD